MLKTAASSHNRLEGLWRVGALSLMRGPKACDQVGHESKFHEHWRSRKWEKEMRFVGIKAENEVLVGLPVALSAEAAKDVIQTKKCSIFKAGKMELLPPKRPKIRDSHRSDTEFADNAFENRKT